MSRNWVVAGIATVALAMPLGVRAQTHCQKFRSDAAFLTGLVGEFQQRHGRLPSSLGELREVGWLREVPVSPRDGRPLKLVIHGSTWEIADADGRPPPSRLTCVTDGEWVTIGAWLVAAVGVLGFVITRRWAFLLFSAVFLIGGGAFALLGPVH